MGQVWVVVISLYKLQEFNGDIHIEAYTNLDIPRYTEWISYHEER